MLIKIAVAVLAVVVLVIGAAYFGQRRLMYFPDRARTPPAAAGLPEVGEVLTEAPDGVGIVNWWGKAKPGQPTLLYFHGNGGSLAGRAPRFERFMGQGWGVFMMAYRGYAGSGGTPTETDNIADAIRAYDYLAAQGLKPGEIILYGESLGTGVAARVAVERRAAGLILEAPYTSTVAVGAMQYPYLPVALAMADRYETDRIIAGIAMPLLVIHGARDPVIPVAMGRRLAGLAREPKRFVEFPEGGHSDLYLPPSNALNAVRAWVAELGAPR